MAGNIQSYRWPQSSRPQQQDGMAYLSGYNDTQANVLANPYRSNIGTSVHHPQAAPAPSLIDYQYTGMLPPSPGSFLEPHTDPETVSMGPTSLTSSSPCARPRHDGMDTIVNPLYQPLYPQQNASVNHDLYQSPKNTSKSAASNLMPAMRQVGEYDPFAEIMKELMDAQGGGPPQTGSQDVPGFNESSKLAPYQSMPVPPGHLDMQSIDFGDSDHLRNFNQEASQGLSGWNDGSVPPLVDINEESLSTPSNFEMPENANLNKRKRGNGHDKGYSEGVEGFTGFGAIAEEGSSSRRADSYETRPDKRIRGSVSGGGREAPMHGARKPRPQVNIARQAMAQSQLGKSEGTAGRQSKIDRLHRRRKSGYDVLRRREESGSTTPTLNGNVQGPFSKPEEKGQAGPKWPADPFAISKTQKSAFAVKSKRADAMRHRPNAETGGGSRPSLKRSHQGQPKNLEYDPSDAPVKIMPTPAHRQGMLPAQPGTGKRPLNPARTTKREVFAKPRSEADENQSTEAEVEAATVPVVEMVGDDDNDVVIGPVRRRRSKPTRGSLDAEPPPKALIDLSEDGDEDVDDMASLLGEDEDLEKEEDNSRGRKRRRTYTLTGDAPAPIVQRASKLVASPTNLNRKSGNRSRPGDVIAQSMSPLVMSSLAVPPQTTSPGAIPPQAAAPVMPLRRSGKYLPPGHPTPLYINSSVNLSQPPLDYREKEPKTQKAYQSLQEALEPTRVAYYEWTGAVAPVTDGWKSYMDQWRELRDSFDFEWGMCTHKLFNKQPKLFRLPAWNTSVENWPEPVKDRLYYGPLKYGHRAPIREDGKLMDLPGALLEEASKAKDRNVFMIGVMQGLKHMAPAVWNHHYR